MIRGGLGGGGQAECTSLMVFAQPDGPSQVGIQKFSIFWDRKDLDFYLLSDKKNKVHCNGVLPCHVGT